MSKPNEMTVPAIDPALRNRELSGLAKVLKHPVTVADLKLWITASADRRKVFEETFWGTIR